MKWWSLSVQQSSVCLSSALTLLEAMCLPPKFTSRPGLHVACKAGTHMLLPLALLCRDRLDTSESLHT